MNTIITFLKDNAWKVSTVVFLLLFLSKGCTNTKLTKLEEKTIGLQRTVDSLKSDISSRPSKKDVRDEMERVMFDYLIYEDDLDKGKTSLSEIKNKIQSND
jgi:uncharacterized membrane protein